MPSNHIATNFFQLNPDGTRELDATQLHADEERLKDIAARIEQLRAETADLISRRGQDRAGVLQQSVEREVELNRLGRKLRQLDRVGPQACLGFIEFSTTGERLYVGRIGLSDEAGNQLMVDWRTPAAEPFFSATHANPCGLSMRRRYRWRRQMITNFWDEVFDVSKLGVSTTLDDHSAFLASLGEQRSGKMQDVLATIHEDQDAIIRQPSAGALVVDGGPGTGKTVVALHRAAYLLYADAQLKSRGGRVLVVSPHSSYTAYVSDILPNLGEDDVLVSTLSNMVSNADSVGMETVPQIDRIKSSGAMVDAVERAVRVFEQPPGEPLRIETPWGDVALSPAMWSSTVDSLDVGLDHNAARTQLRDALIDELAARLSTGDASCTEVERELRSNGQLIACLDEYWPVLEPENLLRTLYSNGPLLRYCARRVRLEDIESLLQAVQGPEWTESDLPLLDAARFLVGDPQGERAQLRRQAALASELTALRRVIDDLIGSADDKEDLTSQLMNADLQDQLLAQQAVEEPTGDMFQGPFSHVIIDEAQDLSDAQWAMVMRRCPSGSLTIVGDRAQAVGGFRDSWAKRLARAGIKDIRVARLSINYRTTSQVMDAAAEVILQHMPEANIPASIRRDGAPVRYAAPDQLEHLLDAWLEDNDEGVATVIGHDSFVSRPRVSVLTPDMAKGLEFDLVLLYRPERFGHGIHGAVRRYVSMTRATSQLIVLQETPT